MTQQQTTVELGFNTDQLRGLIGAVEEAPEKGQTVWKANTSWKKGDGFRSEATIRDFDRIKMDEPEVLGGSNTAPNMVEMVLASYGCCLTTGYVMTAGLQGIELDDVKIEIEGDLDLNGFFDLQDAWPGYTTIRATVHLSAPTARDEQLQALHEHVTRTSPVGSILAKPINVITELQL